MNKGKAILGVLTGIVAGATLGLLFAPDKRSKTNDTSETYSQKKKKGESKNESFENEDYK